jgi:hypothetical protein
MPLSGPQCHSEDEGSSCLQSACERRHTCVNVQRLECSDRHRPLPESVWHRLSHYAALLAPAPGTLRALVWQSDILLVSDILTARSGSCSVFESVCWCPAESASSGWTDLRMFLCSSSQTPVLAATITDEHYFDKTTSHVEQVRGPSAD